MLNNLPAYITVVFILTTFITLGFLYVAIKRPGTVNANIVLAVLLIWLALQAILAWKGVFNTDTKSMPPKFIFVAPPALLAIIILFATAKGRRFIDSLSLETLTYLHIVRIPVEICLYWLCIEKTIPGLMTFEGRNFDILSGITAPIIAYVVFSMNKGGKTLLLIWNFLALGLLINIVANAVLSAPFAFQQFAFDQPDIAVLYFPFNWLPAFIVPVVLFSHLVSIRQLLKK